MDGGVYGIIGTCIAVNTRATAPPHLPKVGDTAYIGTSLKTPHKKPKKKELTDKQKRYNQKLSSARVCVEHAIGRMKRYQIRNSVPNGKFDAYIALKVAAEGLMFRWQNLVI